MAIVSLITMASELVHLVLERLRAKWPSSPAKMPDLTTFMMLASTASAPSNATAMQ